MAIFRGVGGAGTASDNAFLLEISEASEAAQAAAEQAEQSALAAVNAEVSSATFNTSDGVLTLTKTGGATVTADLDGRFLTSYTETNDLSTAVTWANVPDANITESSVTQHLTASNVSAAGALMDSEVTNLAQVKAFDSSDYATSAQGTTADNALPKAGGQMTGNITFSGTQTVDGRDLSVDGAKLDGIEANATADQTGAEIKTAYEAEADTNAFTDADHSKLDGIEANADVTDTANVTSAGALMATGGQMTGNITFSGTQTVDGRDLSVDGSKLDNLLYRRTSDAQLTFFVNTSLSTLPTTKGRCFSLATPFDCVRFVDVEFEITYNSSTSTNDIIVTLGLVVPSGTHTIHNLGTATQITDSAYSNGYADRWFSVDGDKSHLFSHFCGVADSSTPSSPTYVNAWVYRADLDKTYFNAGIFGTNGISNGDTVYLHPFDWENSGTVIQENYNMDSTTAYGLQREVKTFRVKTAYDDSRLEYRILAREEGSSDTATIEDINVIMTDYEV